ncbi:hypothetical protein L2E82_08524 [Cichorium intybus]|uniref:Uncharacterized protein n=1 Tax=Cichorium intybus TaxID=13427 RepID=A0ACB9G6J2_CICIN|nr:hypothetical protein L2E82_08524 [Cichorium intybus]
MVVAGGMYGGLMVAPDSVSEVFGIGVIREFSRGIGRCFDRCQVVLEHMCCIREEELSSVGGWIQVIKMQLSLHWLAGIEHDKLAVELLAQLDSNAD